MPSLSCLHVHTLLAEELGHATARHGGIKDIVQRHHGRPIAETIGELEQIVDDVGRRLQTMATPEFENPSGLVPGLSNGGYLALLSLATWTLADDIRLAVGRAETSPETPHLQTIAEMLPAWVAIGLDPTDTDARPTLYRLDLTGRAATEFAIGAGDGLATESIDADVTIACDSLEFCKLIAGRRAPATFDYLAIGDIDLARSLIAALVERGRTYL